MTTSVPINVGGSPASASNPVPTQDPSLTNAALRDALRGASSKTLTDLFTELASILTALQGTLAVGGTVTVIDSVPLSVSPPHLSSGTDSVTVAGSVTASSPLTFLVLDYAARSDTNPVYVGKAASGSSLTDPASVAWTVYKYAYDGSARLIESDFRTGMAWFNRTAPTPAWSF